jgi:rhamnosyltransferase
LQAFTWRPAWGVGENGTGDQALKKESSESIKNGVCAVLVTFRPDSNVDSNISAVRPQVQAMVVVDNGSSQNALQWLRIVKDTQSFHLIENGENFGLPAALNRGMEWALAGGFRWVVLFDQDSTATPGMIEALLDAYNKHSAAEKVGIVATRYVNRSTGLTDAASPKRLGDNSLDATWTSGSLLPADVIREVGGFEPCLVIDLLDLEISLRVRSAGYKIVQADDAVLLHEAGFPKTRKILGLFTLRTSNHGPVRRYYRTRNRIWIARRYRGQISGILWQSILAQTRDFVRTMICEENKWHKFTHTAMGIRDGLIGRMGKTLEL